MRMPKLLVRVDRDACIGCGLAPAVCSKVFELIDGKNAVTEPYRVNGSLSEGEVPVDLKDCVKEAADKCPVNAITFEEVD